MMSKAQINHVHEHTVLNRDELLKTKVRTGYWIDFKVVATKANVMLCKVRAPGVKPSATRNVFNVQLFDVKECIGF